MQIESCTITNVGKIRKNNEDNFYVNGKYKTDTDQLSDKVCKNSWQSRNLYAVCDGMGGEEFGETASLIGVSTLRRYQNVDFKEHVNEYIESANQQICDLMVKNDGARSGTTFAAVFMQDNKATVFNVGDSRVYIFRKSELKQISVDHTHVQQMINMGILTPEAARTHRDRHIITQHLGIFPTEMAISPFISEDIKLKPGDVFLLCSDGLTDMLNDAEIESVMKQGKTIEETVEMLVNEALAHGGRDNVTVQMIRFSKKKKSFFARLFRK